MSRYVKVFYLGGLRAHLTTPRRCPQEKRLTFYSIFSLRLFQLLCLQGSVQPAEIRDLMVDFGLETGLFI